MAGSPDGQGLPYRDDTALANTVPADTVPADTVPANTVPANTVTAGAAPTHAPTLANPAGETAPAFTSTQTVAGSGPGDAARPGPSAALAAGGRPGEMVRHGPGVPATTAADRTGPTAEEVWRTGLPGGKPRRKGWRRRLIGPALTVALFIASIVVIYARLHHAPFGVSGVVITGQAQHGCTVDVTGRVSTSGAAGTLSYEWTFQPQAGQPQAESQTVAAGQTSVDVTAEVEGQGSGTLSQTATLRVLAPGQGSATAHVVLSC